MKKNVVMVFNRHNVKGDTTVPSKKSLDKEKMNCKIDGSNSKNISLPKIVTVNNYEESVDFFNEYDVSKEVLYKLFEECKAKVKIWRKYMEVVCHQDRWKILFYGKKVILQHNNYEKNIFGDRFFTDGYHAQMKTDVSLTKALKYIINYDYDRIHSPEKIFIKNFQELLTARYERVFEKKKIQ